MTGRITGGISPISWFGGKYYIAKNILPYFPKHHCYVEPFCGAAQIFFQKTPSRNEVLNDINGELINFFMVLRDDPDFFTRRASHSPASRQLFEFYLRDQELHCRKERAWRFFYLNRLSFSGCRLGEGKIPSCCASPGRGRAKLLKRTVESMEGFSDRLRDAYIENLPYSELLERYDSKDTFFYLDPPYFGYEDAYGQGYFNRIDYEKLADILGGMDGKFLLSMNDVPLAREVFGKFESVKIGVKYFANDSASPKCTNELLFANYPLIKSWQKSLLED